jgi:hypothetical protein
MPRQEARVDVTPKAALESQPVILRGTGWPDCPLHITLAGKPARIARVIQGYPAANGVRPAQGSFAVQVATFGLKPGRHEISIGGSGASGTCALEIRERVRPTTRQQKRDENLRYWRDLAFFSRRFAHLGYVPQGMMAARMNSLARLRGRQEQPPACTQPSRGIHPYPVPYPRPFPWPRPWPRPFSPPVPGGTNWTPAGPASEVAGGAGLYPAYSGRVLSVAVDPATPSRMYIGTSNSGVWRSEDSGATWSARTDDQPVLSIGALAIDPNSPNRVFAGTGEYNSGNSLGGYYGLGLLYSQDSGTSWSQLAESTFERAAFTRILFDPNDTVHHMFASCDAGIYESKDGGNSWTLLYAGSASDLVLQVTGAGLQLIAGVFGQGLVTSTLSGGTWSAWTAISSPAFPSDLERIALGQCRNSPQYLWAAFGASGALAAIANSSDGGQTWNAVPVPAATVYQTDFNLYIAVHPSSPNTVFLGVNKLFQLAGSMGSYSWNVVAGGPGSYLHDDHHAMEFDPSNANNIYAGCDGGIYFSGDGGATWDHRNHDLNTLQCYCVCNHPQWAAVMLAGTQDNGGAFATGAPAWILDQWPGQSHNELEGDIVSAAIDPQNPSYMYYMLYFGVWVSSDGGQFWTNPYNVSGPAEWNTPLIVDPANSGVVYAGANTLVRSADHGTTFNPVTPALTGNITSIAVHPANSDIVYVSTSQGHVYRVQRTGIDWTLPNVTTTDVTAAPLPAGMYTSSVAVDSGGGAWVSFSEILLSEETGVFSEDHVYFLPGGSTTWQDRSTGLAQANPVNAIAIDPTNDNTVFCGADTSVFRWDAGTSSWTVWDQGLPNSPVYALAIHGPSRLIRAATYGRGIWERPIDLVPQLMVDIYMRDDILDDGRGPAPAGVPHPFSPSNLVWWWQSEDVKVDAPPFQTPAPVTDDVALANQVVHQNPQRGATNRFYAQLHNRGPLAATNIQVRAFFADASLGLPNLPADFWNSPKPFGGNPSAVNWTPIGPAATPPDLEAGHTAVVNWEWTVPATAAQHSCLLVVATCDEDVLSVAGDFSVADIVVNQNNATLKNLMVVP